MSLVEVVVALMIFSFIALGVGYSAITIIRMTEDSRSRQVASNLATSELDRARAIDDPFDIVNGTRVTVVNNTTYTIVRSTSWVTTSGADVGCGSGAGTLQAKRVNVSVTWNGMLTTTQAVRSDTLIAPDSRINDPSLGTIRVSVLGVAGTGTSGVSVTITPTSGGEALTDQPDNTDTDGCSYALKVAPGTYKVAISRSTSVDSVQVTAPFKSVTVTAGGSVATQFQYDYWGTFDLSYASNYSSGSSPVLPTNLDTTYLSSYGPYIDSGPQSQINLHPIPSGYAGIAGKYVAPTQSGAGCVSVDPAAWLAATVNGDDLDAGVRSAPVAAAPQGDVDMDIPMGVATVTFTTPAFLTAVSATAPSSVADPGCATAMTYSYGQVLKSGTTVVALPYGSWTLYSSTTATGAQTVIAGAKVAPNTLGYLTGDVLTLDPRISND